MTKLLAPPALILLSTGCWALELAESVTTCDEGELLDDDGICRSVAEGVDTAEADTDTTGEDTGFAPSVAIAEGFHATGYAIELMSAPSGTTGFRLGLAETELGAANGWFGEDCLNGTAGNQHCHEFTGTKGELQSVNTINDIHSSLTTLFDGDGDGIGDAYDSSGYDKLTYYVELLPSGACFVFGDDPSYYSTFGCTVLM